MKAFLASFSSQEPRYHRIGSEDWDEAERGGVPPTIQWRRNCFTVRLAGCTLKGALGFVGSMALLMLLAFAGSCDEFTHPDWFADEPLETELPGLSPSSDSDPSNLKLRIIMPADDPGPDLCKTLLSAAANGYPAPIIVNWGRDFNKGEHDMGSSHLGKIDGTLNLLDALFSQDAPDQERLTEDDLVMVLDAYDVWFQLPPQLLIQRFLAQNAAANARIMRSFSAGANVTAVANYSDEAEEETEEKEPGDRSGGEGAWSGEEKQLRQVQPLPLVTHPRQSIVISAQKKCWPTRRYGNTVRCDAMPPSPARADLYGPWTDYSGAPHDNRPRHVNSGSILGTAGAMRRMFRAVQDKVEAGEAAAGSDQGVFAHVMGEQEVWRREAEAWNARVVAGSYDEWVDVAGETRRLDDMGKKLDYGIGLDWVQDMFLPTVFAENDGDYLLLNDSDAVHAASIAHDVFPVRIKGLPDDMRDIAPPLDFAGVSGPDEDDGEADTAVAAAVAAAAAASSLSSSAPPSSLFPSSSFTSLDWTEVPLYTDYWSANVPVTVHHNAHKGGLKAQRLRDWWELTWFFPYLREVAMAVTQKSGLSDLVLGDDEEADQDRSGSPASLQRRDRRNDTTAALARVPGRETELVYWAAETDAQRPAPKIFHENRKLAKGSGSGSLATLSLEEAGWPALCGGPGHEEWWDEVFKDGRGPLT